MSVEVIEEEQEEEEEEELSPQEVRRGLIALSRDQPTFLFYLLEEIAESVGLDIIVLGRRALGRWVSAT
jgi:hypothetical protein